MSSFDHHAAIQVLWNSMNIDEVIQLSKIFNKKKLSPVYGQSMEKKKGNYFSNILLWISSFDHKEASDQVLGNSMHIQ